VNNVVYENEITVEVDTSLENLKEILKENDFTIKEEYDLIDIYMVKNDRLSDNHLETLKNCLLIRNIITDNKNIKTITYKYKEYNDLKEIIKQGKVDCYIESIEEGKKLLEVIGYNKLMEIKDHLIVYANNKTEFAVQLVNNKHIYIEMEEKCNHINRSYTSVEEMINDLKQYNIPIKNDDYFVKKAEIELIEINNN